MRIDWVIDIIKQFVIVNQIRTTNENIIRLHDYYIAQGYADSIGVVCDALIADSKTLEILRGDC